MSAGFVPMLNGFAAHWWLWMWPMTWQVSLLVAIVGLIDVLGRKRVWPQVLYALWVLVFVKLLLPPMLASHPGSPHITGKSANNCAV